MFVNRPDPRSLDSVGNQNVDMARTIQHMKTGVQSKESSIRAAGLYETEPDESTRS